MSEAITEQRWKELTACFQALDANHDGRIDKQELDQILGRFTGVSDELRVEIRQNIMSVADKDGDGAIDQREFVQLLSTPQFEAVVAALEHAATQQPASTSN